ncbi:MAG TPA: hypothetical protein DF296_02940 [Candidatus Margulisbacteria bacterium]|nr:MAG: hypothetical protein A2X43_13725 [Candidatus Margulisbacteria bacterium GWD2_39_127]OGI05563.1 MAG: hypothetical protein A2X42_00725 [Candidatus Margulisbacteria bacterium GWF2_38_17]OGI08355.1 MAG: hypothetical protein A2X41_10615 [Candidatus Margulisbacteria bacterium GWE2_39_32]HAR63164.1 hypothetical protein [Candidatus Margulisiibacteriota bacterium]HCT84136.1 hypothetical protein [Candidatus Margulisiibacteriota bacterium]
MKIIVNIWIFLVFIFSMNAVAHSITAPGIVITNNAQITYIKKAQLLVVSSQTTLSVNEISGMTIVPTQQPSILFKTTDKHDFPYRVTNNGNKTMTLLPSIVSITPSWSVELVIDNNKDGIRSITDNISVPVSLNLAIGGSYCFIVTIRPPAFPVSANTTGLCLISLVTTGNVYDGECYKGFDNISYGGPDSVMLTLNASVSEIYSLKAQYDAEDTLGITDNYWIDHSTPYMYWNASIDNSGFSFIVTTNSAGVPDNIVDLAADISGYQIPTLNAGVYYFKIKLRDLNGVWGNSLSFAIKFDNLLPGVPGTPNDTGSVITKNLIPINWDAAIDYGPSGLSCYEVQIGSQPGMADVASLNIATGNSYFFSGKDENKYYFKVRSVDIAGNRSDWSGNSDGIYVYLNPTLDVRARVGFDDYRVIANNSWTRNSQPYFYWINASQNSGYTYSFSTDNSVIPEESIDTLSNFYDPGQLTNEIYYFKIKMLKDMLLNGTKIWSNMATFTYKMDDDVTKNMPAPVIEDKYVFSNPGRFSWQTVTDNYHGSGITDYILRIWGQSVVGALFEGSVGSANSFSFSGVDGNTYFAQLKIRDGAGNESYWSEFSPTMSYLLTNDTDHDGVPNDWELSYGFNPLDPIDATKDYDYDGLNNISEFNASTNPGINNRLLSDSDHDGMPDSYEQKYGFVLNNLSDAYADPDGDHVPNIIEYYRGTNPRETRASDGDGMADDWEKTYGLNPYISDGAGDLDGDGKTNLQEFLAGTYPNDSDEDGSPDPWETAAGLDTHDPSDGSYFSDKDHDGVPNWLEYLSGTNSNNNIDTDNDGMSDDYERIYGFTLNNPIDADEDSDGDGVKNIDECKNYTDPRNPNTTPPVLGNVSLNGKSIDSNQFVVLTTRTSSLSGIAAPGTIVELWKIIGLKQELIGKVNAGVDGSYTLPFSGPDPSLWFQLLAIDRAGNVNVLSRTIIYDTYDPTITDVRIDNSKDVIKGDIMSKQPKVTAKISDSGTGVDITSITLTLYDETRMVTNSYTLTNNALTYDAATNVMTFIQPVSLTPGFYDLTISVKDLSTRAIEVKISSLNVVSGSNRINGTINYPNPFNPNIEKTNITYSLNESMDITLVIYNNAADKIWERIFAPGEEGAHAGYNVVAWDGKTDSGERMGNGVYLYHIVSRLNGKRTVFSRGKILIRR